MFSTRVFFFFILCLCIPTKKTKQKNVDQQALRTRKECSVSITQQKHKMEEIQFCSKVWEKHLEESWWVRDRESDAEGGESEKDKDCVRGDLSTFVFMGFFFHSLNFSQPAEMAYCSDHSAFSWCREVNGYLLHGYKH